MVVSGAGHGVRLDHYLSNIYTAFSRSQCIAAIKSGHITVNGVVVKAGYRLRAGDTIIGSIAQTPTDTCVVPQHIDFSVLYEDEWLLAIAKPAKLAIHPGAGNRDHTLVNGLVYRFEELAEIGDSARPGIVHRLDKDTSGVVLVARTPDVHRTLAQMFKARRVNKTYLAIVRGVPDVADGRIVAPIGRHPVHRTRMAVRLDDGKYAVSNWRVVRTFATFSLLEVSIETGRTHQIRVHLRHIGHPVAGDDLYGPKSATSHFPRQMLHAWRIGFAHPVDGRQMLLEAPLPKDFVAALDKLEEEPCSSV